jgi:hypothetical protein
MTTGSTTFMLNTLHRGMGIPRQSNSVELGIQAEAGQTALA